MKRAMHMDLSPHITLTPGRHRIYRSARIALYAGFVIGCCAVAWRIAFPPVWRTFDMTTPGALVNSIAPPSADRDTIVFDAVAAGDLGRATVTLALADGVDLPAHVDVTVRRGYGAAILAPRTTPDAQSPATPAAVGPFAPGTLVAREGGVWVVTDPTRMAPIADAATLLLKGWSFDDVTPAAGEAGLYDRARMFTFEDSHPEGTVFHAADTATYWQLRDGALVPIGADDSVVNNPGRSVVTIAEASRERTVGCAAAPSALPWRSSTYRCQVDLAPLADLPGSSYVTAVGVSGDSLRDIAIVLRPDPTPANLRTSLGLIRQRLGAQYGF